MNWTNSSLNSYLVLARQPDIKTFIIRTLSIPQDSYGFLRQCYMRRKGGQLLTHRTSHTVRTLLELTGFKKDMPPFQLGFIYAHTQKNVDTYFFHISTSSFDISKEQNQTLGFVTNLTSSENMSHRLTFNKFFRQQLIFLFAFK